MPESRSASEGALMIPGSRASVALCGADAPDCTSRFSRASRRAWHGSLHVTLIVLLDHDPYAREVLDSGVRSLGVAVPL